MSKSITCFAKNAIKTLKKTNRKIPIRFFCKIKLSADIIQRQLF